MSYVRNIIDWVAHTSPPRPGHQGVAIGRASDHPLLPIDVRTAAANDDDASPNPTVGARVLPWRADAGRVGQVLTLLNQVVGATIRDRDGRAAGEITDLSLDKNTGRVSYAIASFGRFLGLRSRFHPIPWKLLRYDTKGGGYTIPLTMSEMNEAPSLTLAELDELIAGDKIWRDRLASYYNTLSAMRAF